MLYQKLRPKLFSDVLGNASTISALSKMLKSKDTMPHTFLFYGPSGCGKTTLARILATELKCNVSDMEELNGANQRGIDDARGMIDRANNLPMFGKSRVFIMDEMHMLTRDAMNSLLKILEDVPSHAYFILCSTEPDKILKTIRNRCTAFQVELLSEDDIGDLLDYALGEVKMDVPDDIFNNLIICAEGSPRKALVLLEQVLSVENEKEQKKLLIKGAIEKDVIDLCRAILNGDSWSKVAGIYKSIPNPDAEVIRRIILGYMKSVLLNSIGGKAITAARIISYMEDDTFNSGEGGLVGRIFLSQPVR